MNGLNSVGVSSAATGAAETDKADFNAIFATGIVNTSAVLMQFIGADILESVMKDDTAVD